MRKGKLMDLWRLAGGQSFAFLFVSLYIGRYLYMMCSWNLKEMSVCRAIEIQIKYKYNMYVEKNEKREKKILKIHVMSSSL